MADDQPGSPVNVRSRVSDRRRAEALPLPERASLLALARSIREALPEGQSHARELVCELERLLEGLGDSSEAG